MGSFPGPQAVTFCMVFARKTSHKKAGSVQYVYQALDYQLSKHQLPYLTNVIHDAQNALTLWLQSCKSVLLLKGVKPPPPVGQRIDGIGSDDRQSRQTRIPTFTLLLARTCFVPVGSQGPPHLLAKFKRLRRASREKFPTKPYLTWLRAHSLGGPLFTFT